MISSKVVVIGGGIAGMEVAYRLSLVGISVVLIEKSDTLGGHLHQWYLVFPDFLPAHQIVGQLKQNIQEKVKIFLGSMVTAINQLNQQFILTLNNDILIQCDAIVIATGFDIFPAIKKEEYGYKIYDNVITSADLELLFQKEKMVTTKSGKIPRRLAFIHCVGSRDEKVKNRYCSKVCCITAVKQAIELAKKIPNIDLYSFYMDLRMFDRQFEDIYYQAQSVYKVKFIRGRVSEIAENSDTSLLLKAEDTLLGRPLRLEVDLAVLMVGMIASKGMVDIGELLKIDRLDDKFFKTLDFHLQKNKTFNQGIFLAGTCTGPKTITETIADARSAAVEVYSF